MYKVNYVFPSGHVETFEVEGWPKEFDDCAMDIAKGYEVVDGWECKYVCPLPTGVVMEVWQPAAR